MTKTDYANYLASEHWQALRKEMLTDIPACEKCSLPRWLAEIAYDQDLHVHHLSYANLGNEDCLDLQVLCRRCHEMETFGRSELKAPKSANCSICRGTHWNYRSEQCLICESFASGSEIFHIRDRQHPYLACSMRTHIAHLLAMGDEDIDTLEREILEAVDQEVKLTRVAMANVDVEIPF